MLMWKILICFSDIARARIGAMKVAGRPHQTQQSPMVTSEKNFFFFFQIAVTTFLSGLSAVVNSSDVANEKLTKVGIVINFVEVLLTSV